jgi:hypothetical protein
MLTYQLRQHTAQETGRGASHRPDQCLAGTETSDRQHQPLRQRLQQEWHDCRIHAPLDRFFRGRRASWSKQGCSLHHGLDFTAASRREG